VVGRYGDPATIPSGATIEVFIEHGPRDRPNDADESLANGAHVAAGSQDARGRSSPQTPPCQMRAEERRGHHDLR